MATTIEALLERQVKLFSLDRVAAMSARDLFDELRVYDHSFACLLCGYATAEAAQGAANSQLVADAVDKWSEVWIRLIEESARRRW